jgi:hypothetical protein
VKSGQKSSSAPHGRELFRWRGNSREPVPSPDRLEAANHGEHPLHIAGIGSNERSADTDGAAAALELDDGLLRDGGASVEAWALSGT